MKKNQYFNTNIFEDGLIDRGRKIMIVKNPLETFKVPFDDLEQYAIEIPVLERAISLLKVVITALEHHSGSEHPLRLYILKELNNGEGAPSLLMSQDTNAFGIFIAPSLPCAPPEDESNASKL